METNRMEPLQILETVSTFGNVRTLSEIDNQQFRNHLEKLVDTTLKYCQNKIPEPAASEIIRAFLEGDPSKAYINMVELRSGRSLGDQSGPLSHSAVPVDLENKQSHF